jgi:hypothetical protein
LGIEEKGASFEDDFNKDYTARTPRRLDKGNVHSKEASSGEDKRIGILG